MLDNQTVGRPQAAYLAPYYGKTLTALFIFPSVAPGTHVLRMEIRRRFPAGASGDGELTSLNIMLQHAP